MVQSLAINSASSCAVLLKRSELRLQQHCNARRTTPIPRSSASNYTGWLTADQSCRSNIIPSIWQDVYESIVGAAYSIMYIPLPKTIALHVLLHVSKFDFIRIITARKIRVPLLSFQNPLLDLYYAFMLQLSPMTLNQMANLLCLPAGHSH